MSSRGPNSPAVARKSSVLTDRIAEEALIIIQKFLPKIKEGDKRIFVINGAIKGAIRRAIDTYRGNIRIPEHKLNDIRKNKIVRRENRRFFS